MKIMPAIDILNGNVVRLIRGNPADKIIYSNNPIEIAKKWEASGADMLHIVDLDATLQSGTNNIEIISKIIDMVKIPVQLAGGIRSIDAINEMLDKNIARIVLGTIAYRQFDSMRQLVKKKRAEKIVISIDQIDGMVMIDGWKQPSGSQIAQAINLFVTIGIREFLLTSIDRDGTLMGPDFKTLAYASSLTDAKIIASGGISSLEDVLRVRSAGCSSIILGKALYDGKVSIEKAKVLV
jgi:phosphoribosylformimino-5-aminoimidazole carboxamide ribotide isomerase